MREIFLHYPDLKNKLPFLELGNFPTPIQKLKNLGKEIGVENIFIKRDDLSSPLYGGNKIRKLEFLLGDAHRKNKKYLITLGAAGSNYAVAVCIFARKFGFKPTIIFFPQEIASYIKKNLLADFYFKCDMKYSSHIYLVPFTFIKEFIGLLIKNKTLPYYMPMGGSGILGTIGYVNAVLEIRKQIKEKILPEPDYIFSALGTCGTVAGLELGVKIAKLKTKVIAVQVVEKSVANAKRIASLANSTAKYLHKLDNNFPQVKISSSKVVVLKKYFGGKYARQTIEGIHSINLIKKTENLNLEPTYTGKAFAALFDFVKENSLQNKTILFLNTYNSVNLNSFTSQQNYKNLPQSFHKYFKLPVQELEKKIKIKENENSELILILV